MILVTSTHDNLLIEHRRHLKRWDILERYRGHFYNWYDTKTLKPLPPPYISSVDSGNISGHLLTLSQDDFLAL